MEGPEAAYAQNDLYSDVMTNPPQIPQHDPSAMENQNNMYTLPQQPMPNQPLEYKSYTTVHPKSQEQIDKEAAIASKLDLNMRGKQLYVGNLTWWTNDEELSNAIQECGVNDLLSVKFFENRINGQSKGFSLIEVGSDTSHRLVMERLSNTLIHNQKPMVMFVSKQNLALFEQQARKDKSGPGSREDEYQERKRNNDHDKRNKGNQPQMQPQMQQQPQMIAQPPPQMINAPFPGAPMQLAPQMFDPNLGQLQPQMGFPGAIPPGSIVVDSMGNIVQGGLPGLAPAPLPPGAIPMNSAPQQFAPRPGVAPHMNPSFPPPDPNQQPPPIDPVTGVPLQTMGMNEQDMESMRRNQAVASTAIQRAMGDANQGEFENGIETLVTAISLIKQSTTANTDAAQVLVQSLQDCLHGLESQLVQKGPSRSHRGDRYEERREHSRDREDRHRDDRRYNEFNRGRGGGRYNGGRDYNERRTNRSRSRDKRERGDRDRRDRSRDRREHSRRRDGKRDYSLSPVRGPIIPPESAVNNSLAEEKEIKKEKR